MAEPTIHTLETAPDGSKPLLEKSKKAAGRIPGLHGVMATSPALLDGYQHLHALVVGKTGFDATERTVVWQSINVEHACHYCVPAHTAIARKDEVDDEVTEALRNETPLPDARLEALRDFTLAVVRDRGNVGDEDVEAFRAAGYDDRAILDVILIVGQKVMSNYTNHIFETPVDEPFRKFAWAPGTDEAA